MKSKMLICLCLLTGIVFWFPVAAQSPSFIPEQGVTKGFYLTDDNNKMYYETYGSGKTSILFVHGWSCNSRCWDDQIDFFKDKFKVILIDLPGFGNSEHNRTDWSMQHYGTDVAGLCRKLGLKNVYLVGWSLGTAIVIEAARLLGKSVKAVILVDQMHKTEYLFDSIKAENYYKSQASRFKDFSLWSKSVNNDSAIATRIIRLMPPDNTMPAWWKPSIITFFNWQEHNLKESVSELRIPVRAINASNIKTNEEQWKSFYKDYKLIVFENSNHFLLWQYPQKFNETVLQFISEDSK